MDRLTVRLQQNLADIRGQIADAAAASGRAGDEIKLVAVTKYVSEPVTRALASLGCTSLGESKPQELWAKAEALADLAIEWHFIGHLQRNKIRRTLPLVSLVHSIDSVGLLVAISQMAGPEKPCQALLEVNVSGEEAKHGFAPRELPGVVESLENYPGVRIMGLMCMAGLEGGQKAAQLQFARLRQLRDELSNVCSSGITLKELSMGMSGDFQEAIREGATIVRIGSALVEGVD